MIARESHLQDIAIISAFVAVYALISARLSTTIISAPMLFIGFGLLMGHDGLGVLDLNIENERVHFLVEITLVMVLFNDAALIDWRVLRNNGGTPARLLGIGLPLTIALGILAALLLGNALTFAEACLIAVILAPTDAALSQGVVIDELVPNRIRQSLSVESGLNDGIVTPLVTVFLAAAAGEATHDGFQMSFAVKEIAYGAGIGVGAGILAAVLASRALRAGWMSHDFARIGVAAVPAFVFALSTVVEGNAFIAAFVAGIVYGNVARNENMHNFEFSEQASQLLMIATFVIFGAVFVGDAIDHLTWRIALYSVLSLAVIRPVSVAVSMLWSGFRPSTVAFMGWFGPRGLASIVFAFMVLEKEVLATHQLIFDVVAWTVFLSTVAHGLTAQFGVRWYARHADALAADPSTPEGRHASDLSTSRVRVFGTSRPKV